MSTINLGRSGILGISYKETSLLKSSLKRASEKNNIAINKINRAKLNLQVDRGSSRIRIESDNLQNLYRKLKNNNTDIEKAIKDIDYIVRRFKEVDSKCANKVKLLRTGLKVQKSASKIGSSLISLGDKVVKKTSSFINDGINAAKTMYAKASEWVEKHPLAMNALSALLNTAAVVGAVVSVVGTIAAAVATAPVTLTVGAVVGIVGAVVGGVLALNGLINDGVKIYNNLKNDNNKGFDIIESGLKKSLGDETGGKVYVVINLIDFASNFTHMAKGFVKGGTSLIEAGKSIKTFPSKITGMIDSFGSKSTEFIKDAGKIIKISYKNYVSDNSVVLGSNLAGEAQKIGSSIKDAITELADTKKSLNSIERINKAEGVLDPKLTKYVCGSFEGIGKEVQDNFNKYLRENVWCDETLSNAEKIEIMKANFDKLTPEQKINFNVSNEVRVLKNADYSNWGEWPDIDWPDFPGLNKDTAKSVYNEITGEIEIANDLDRLGSPYGNNLGVVEDGYHCTQDERSICYIENEYARNSYKFDGTYYKDAIDAIKDFDISNPSESVDKINNIIDKLNEKYKINNPHIEEGDILFWNKDYNAFQNEPKLVELCKEKDIKSTYGVMGEAEKWMVNKELITSGGAGQINIPIKVRALEDIGILKNIGGW